MGRSRKVSKDDLIHAVKQQILQQGQSKITLKKIAEQAGVTQGVLFYHFKTKDRLLISLLEKHLDMVPEEMNAFQRDEPIESMRACLKETEYQTHIRSEEQQLLFELMGLAMHHREMKQVMIQIMQERVKEMSELIDQETSTGRIFRAVLDGLSFQAMFDPDFDAKETFKQVSVLFSKMDTK